MMQLFSGRKRDSLVWKYFTYDAQSDKSRRKCTVVLCKENDQERVCNTTVSGTHWLRNRQDGSAILK